MAFSEAEPNITFDMRFHAFVMAVPLRQVGDQMALGEPIIAMNQGDVETVTVALRAIADMIERNGTETIA